ncbi:MAG: 2,4-dihydroxyhept-2-ene-1,7-dioic acid aldolase [Spirochaetes bacterium]|nr:2,4-dihydroxyhept-2-ene-1,7-dioic acid aldolase [Spirochaetota bacterium]
MNPFGPNPIRKAFLDRRMTLGAWIQVGHPASAEILSRAGYPWIAVDLEHTDITLETAANCFRAMEAGGSIPFARVRENDTLAIRLALDIGARGVLVPLVHDAAGAQKAVRAAKYPPKGVRGFAYGRMNGWGSDFDAYAKAANDDIAVIAMIESREAVENIASILAVDGIDGVFLGPYDMSGSYGVPGETNHPAVREACRKVVEACRLAGKAAGLHVVRPNEANLKALVEDGFTFAALGTDSVFLGEGAVAALERGKKITG